MPWGSCAVYRCSAVDSAATDLNKVERRMLTLWLCIGFEGAVEVQHGFNPFAHAGEDLIAQSISIIGGRSSDGASGSVKNLKTLPAMPSSGFIVKAQVCAG